MVHARQCPVLFRINPYSGHLAVPGGIGAVPDPSPHTADPPDSPAPPRSLPPSTPRLRLLTRNAHWLTPTSKSLEPRLSAAAARQRDAGDYRFHRDHFAGRGRRVACGGRQMVGAPADDTYGSALIVVQ